MEKPNKQHHSIITKKENTHDKYAFKKNRNVLNTFRDNPEFLSTLPQYAFKLLNNISTTLVYASSNYISVDITLSQKGIARIFNKILMDSSYLPESKFLKTVVEKMYRLSGMIKDEFIHILIISCIDSLYSNHSRIQKFAEPVLTEFLDKIVCHPKKSFKNKLDIFPVEGYSTDIYIFNSLNYNGLISPQDKLGILTHNFVPYLQVPELRKYVLNQIYIKSNEDDHWEITEVELQKISDPEMKALIVDNPPDISLTTHTIRKIKYTVRKFNPNLIIIINNVYTPFVGKFNSLFNAIPSNTIGIYSFSKYFDITEWNLGSIFMHKSNIIDNKLLKKAPQVVHNRYLIFNIIPNKIKFIDRILIDSKQFSEYHTVGMSPSHQTILSLFIMYDLMNKDKFYNKQNKSILYNKIYNLLRPNAYILGR